MTSDDVKHHEFVTSADDLYESEQWEGYLALLQTTQLYNLSVDQLAKRAVAMLSVKDTAGAVSFHLAGRHARHGCIHCIMQRTPNPAQFLSLLTKLCVTCRVVCLHCRFYEVLVVVNNSHRVACPLTVHHLHELTWHVTLAATKSCLSPPGDITYTYVNTHLCVPFMQETIANLALVYDSTSAMAIRVRAECRGLRGDLYGALKDTQQLQTLGHDVKKVFCDHTTIKST